MVGLNIPIHFRVLRSDTIQESEEQARRWRSEPEKFFEIRLQFEQSCAEGENSGMRGDLERRREAVVLLGGDVFHARAPRGQELLKEGAFRSGRQIHGGNGIASPS